jgi:RNA polymerase sigma-70 factor (ECF subfamily)
MGVRLDHSVASLDCADPVGATPAELDEALLREIAQGNQLAMRTLFQRHQVRIYRFILRMIHDRALAEDVVSETFFAAWRSADRFEGRSTVSTWLLSIARHKALTAVTQRPLEELDDDTADAIVDDAPDPETTMRAADTRMVLRRCLGALSAEHSEIIDLVYYQEKSVIEISEILDIPVNTVKTRMFYARKRLGVMLEAVNIDR